METAVRNSCISRPWTAKSYKYGLVSAAILVFLALSGSFLCSAADSDAKSPVCEDLTQYKTEIKTKDAYIASLLSEAETMNRTHEDSVKACADVSDKQVKSLQTCQADNKTLGETFNNLMKEKNQLSDKVIKLTAELAQSKGDHEKWITEHKSTNANMSELETRLSSLQSQLNAKTEELASLTTDHATARDKFTSAEKALVDERRLKEENAKNLGECERRRQETQKTLDQGMERVGSLTNKMKEQKEASEKKIQQLNAEREVLKAKLDDESDEYIVSVRMLQKVAAAGQRMLGNTYILVKSVYRHAMTKIPDSWYEMASERYLLVKLTLEPHVHKVGPYYNNMMTSVANMHTKVKDMYNGMDQTRITQWKNKASSAIDTAKDFVVRQSNVLNKKLDQFIVKPLKESQPELEKMIPDSIYDRLLTALFVFVVVSSVLKLSTRLICFAVVDIMCCQCRHRCCGSANAARTKGCGKGAPVNSASSKDKDKKRSAQNPTTNASLPQQQPTSSATRAFRPDSGSAMPSGMGSVTTTSSSTGSGFGGAKKK